MSSRHRRHTDHQTPVTIGRDDWPCPATSPPCPSTSTGPTGRSPCPTGPGPTATSPWHPAGPASTCGTATRPWSTRWTPSASCRLFETLVDDRVQGDRGGVPVRLADRLRLPAPDHRRRAHPRRRDHPGAGPVPRGADRADLRVAGRRPAGHRPLLQLDLRAAAPGGVRPRPGRHHRHRRQRRPPVQEVRVDAARTPTSATSTRPRASPAPSRSSPWRSARR